MTVSFRLIGLTGGIGSGKSTVARLIASRGIPVIDADHLAREITSPGEPALTEIAALWPAVIDMGPDKRLDRHKLGTVVFGDRTARLRLEAIMHPRIAELATKRAADLARAGHSLAFYEASLLVETGRNRELDGLVVVDAPEAVRIQRVAARDGITPAAVRARIAAQLPMAEKRRAATYIIENDGDLGALAVKVDALLAAVGARPAYLLPP